MHLLVTGCGGFVGSRLVRRLLEQGAAGALGALGSPGAPSASGALAGGGAAGDPGGARARVSGTYVGAPPRLRGAALFEADVLDAAAMAHAVRAAGPDAVVHLAGMAHVGESWRRMGEYFRVNVLGTENVLAAATGRRVVLASSAEVYGPVPAAEQPATEERQPDPNSPYAMTKAAAERLALARGAVVARCFNLVGAGQSASFALPAFAEQLAAIERGRGEPVLKVGNLTARRDFVHVDDAVEAYLLLAASGRPGGIYNLASGQSCSIGEALERLMAISGVEARIETDPARVRAVDLPLLVGDAARLRALGWAPRRTLDQALAELWAEARGAAQARHAARAPGGTPGLEGAA